MKHLRKSIHITSLFVALFLISTHIFSQTTWKVDPAHAKVTFSTVHNTISDVQGLFNAFESSVTSSKENFSDAVFTLSVDVNGLTP